jgi:uncharacterized protein (DUF736 family)
MEQRWSKSRRAPSDQAALFKVRDKQNEKGPDWKGGVNVDEVEYELVAWERVSARGTPYLSVSISPPRDDVTAADPGQAGT